MAQRWAINRESATEEEIACAKGCAPTMQGVVRFQALEQLYRGSSKVEVAGLSDRTVRTIDRWVAAFNESGIDGTALKGRAGPPRKIEADKFRVECLPGITSSHAISRSTRLT
ncbi:MAG: helix-turn-helix domain-containing protein [Bdellovibrionales bacterium]|nr:helix-turn-helix domain-containing protein [Bdellovibrionales bacterium]